MQKITSVNNERIKELTKLHLKKYREESEIFLVEGLKSYEELIDSGIEIEEIFIQEEYSEKITKKNTKITFVNEAVLKKLSTTDSTPNIITVARKKIFNIENLKQANKIALFEDIKDAGNLGTIIRSAAAFNIDGIILYGNTVDLYNPKVIRASAGNFFKIPIVETLNIKEITDALTMHNYISTTMNDKDSIQASQLGSKEKYIIMFGSEAVGLSAELIKLAAKNLQIPMNKSVESLNLSTAASIVFYELFKSNA